ncbi:MAG: factor-independent urate hydroxylase [Opitutales bacterium]
MLNLTDHIYGKSRVGVLRARNDGGDRRTVTEFMVSVRSSGEFACAFLDGDNSTTVPTDTVKNNIHCVAKTAAPDTPEAFALALRENFFNRYAVMQALRIEVEALEWERLGDSAHTFTARRNGTPFCLIEAQRGAEPKVYAGIRDFAILKPTGSGYVDYHQCDRTTLPPTTDRVLATKILAQWRYATVPNDPAQTRAAVLDAALGVFVTNYSPSVQRTMGEMAEAVFAAVPEVAEIHLRLPNVHYLPSPIEQFGLENPQEVFYPTGDPHGDIAATFARGDAG